MKRSTDEIHREVSQPHLAASLLYFPPNGAMRRLVDRKIVISLHEIVDMSLRGSESITNHLDQN